MTDKYKISDLAKDFNMKSKDLIGIITEVTGSLFRRRAQYYCAK